MSLINDALKRASEAHHQRGRPGPPGTPLQPVHYSRPPSRGVIWLVALLVVTLITAVVFLWKAWQGETPRPAARPATPLRRSSSVAFRTTSAPAASPVAIRGIKVSTNLVLRTAVTDEAISTTAAAPMARIEPPAETTAPSTNLPAPPPAFPELRLQSIIYRLKRPSAMINGQMAQVGDRIGEALVVEIQRQAVKVEWRGSNRTLSLPGP